MRIIQQQKVKQKKTSAGIARPNSRGDEDDDDDDDDDCFVRQKRAQDNRKTEHKLFGLYRCSFVRMQQQQSISRGNEEWNKMKSRRAHNHIRFDLLPAKCTLPLCACKCRICRILPHTNQPDLLPRSSARNIVCSSTRTSMVTITKTKYSKHVLFIYIM